MCGCVGVGAREGVDTVDRVDLVDGNKTARRVTGAPKAATLAALVVAAGLMPALEEAVRLVPDEPAAQADLAVAYLGSSNLPAAAAPLKRAQEGAPNSGEIEFIVAAAANKQ